MRRSMVAVAAFLITGSAALISMSVAACGSSDDDGPKREAVCTICDVDKDCTDALGEDWICKSSCCRESRIGRVEPGTVENQNPGDGPGGDDYYCLAECDSDEDCLDAQYGIPPCTDGCCDFPYA